MTNNYSIYHNQYTSSVKNHINVDFYTETSWTYNYKNSPFQACLREDSQIDFFTQSIFWMLGGVGVLQMDTLKNQYKIDFWLNNFLKFSCFSQPLKAQMAFKQAKLTPVSVSLQEEDTHKICISKLKIKKPKISFSFF